MVEKLETRHFKLKQKLVRLEKAHEEDNANRGNCTMDTFMLNQSNFMQELSNLHKRDNEVRLPRVNIPVFCGRYSDFPSFRDLFEASIHNNANISKVHKLQYLKGLLKGEAFSLINHLSVTEPNYVEAWDKIKMRYDKRKHVVHTLLKQFMEQPTLHQCCSKSLRHLFDVSDEVIRGLKVLGEEAEGRDPWLVYILANKLDSESKEAWAHETAQMDFPSLAEFFKFLNKRSDAFESLSSMQKTKTNPTKRVTSLSTQSQSTCPLCAGEHYLGKCERFIALPIPERRQTVAEKKLCFNCLSATHQATVCRSKFTCKRCRRKHHLTLHPESENVTESKEEKMGTHIFNAMIQPTSLNHGQAILPTVRVIIKNQYGEIFRCRALLDSGSQSSFISEDCVQRLRLQRSRANVNITGITTGSIKSNGRSLVVLKSLYNHEVQVEVSALIINKLPSKIPANTIKSSEVELMESMQLADPDFHKAAKIDSLIGADQFFTILKSDRRQIGSTILQKTVFGWVVSGQLKSTPISNSSSVFNIQVDVDIDKALRRFWEIEEVITANKLSPEDVKCEAFYDKTFKRQADGRFIVQLPFRETPSKLGNSLSIATQRFLTLERKLSNNENLRNQYIAQIREYIEMGHMTEIPESQYKLNDNEAFYLPHHAVVKESSDTMKVRVVFDGSSKTSSGISLNDILMVGPTIQPTLWTTLMRFRYNRIALTADIEKMYRQVIVSNSDTNYQRLLWRENSTQKIRHYQLIRVTFGLACSAYLAIRSLQQLARDNDDKIISHSIRDNFYVDDFLSGSDNSQNAMDLKENINLLLKEGGFLLRKWRSNIPSLSDDFNNETTTKLCTDKVSTVTILGLHWCQLDDTFTFKVSLEREGPITKRKVLSETSRVFDPLGFLSPSIVLLKILFQKMWLLKIEWDNELPEIFENNYRTVRKEFKYFEQIKIPRFANHY